MSKSIRWGLIGGAVVAGLLMIFLLMPYIIGRKVEQAYVTAFNRFAAHKDLKEFSPSYKYERHWFESFITEEVAYEGHTLTTVSRIAHGPVAQTQAQGWYLGLGAPFELLSVTIDGAKELEDIHAHGAITMLGNFYVESVIDGVEINDVKMAPLHIHAVGNLDDEITLNLDLPNLSYIMHSDLMAKNNAWHVSNEVFYEGLNLRADLDLSSGVDELFMPTHMRIRMKRYGVETHVNDVDMTSTVAMNDFDYTLKTGLTAEDRVINSHHTVDVGSFEVNETNAGPFYASVQLKNIAIDPYLALLKAISNNPNVVTSLYSDPTLSQSLDDILTHHPEFVIDEMYVELPEGKVEATMVLDTAINTDWRATGPLALLQVNSQVTLPQPILYMLVEMYVKQYMMPALLQAPELNFTPAELEAAEKEMIVKTMYDLEFMKLIEATSDGRYRSELSLRGGQLSVNGNPQLSFF